MQNDLITQGVTLMALGMGVVFIFLALLVVTTQAMSAVIGRYLPEPVKPAQQVSTQTPISSGNVSDATIPNAAIPDAKVIAIIQAAIRKHRDA